MAIRGSPGSGEVVTSCCSEPSSVLLHARKVEVVSVGLEAVLHWYMEGEVCLTGPTLKDTASSLTSC